MKRPKRRRKYDFGTLNIPQGLKVIVRVPATKMLVQVGIFDSYPSKTSLRGFVIASKIAGAVLGQSQIPSFEPKG